MSNRQDHQRFDIELIRAGAVVAAFEVRGLRSDTGRGGATQSAPGGQRRRLWHIRLDENAPAEPEPEPEPEPLPPARPGRHRRPDD
jgi:hypothetical protein